MPWCATKRSTFLEYIRIALITECVVDKGFDYVRMQFKAFLLATTAAISIQPVFTVGSDWWVLHLDSQTHFSGYSFFSMKRMHRWVGNKELNQLIIPIWRFYTSKLALFSNLSIGIQLKARSHIVFLQLK